MHSPGRHVRADGRRPRPGLAGPCLAALAAMVVARSPQPAAASPARAAALGNRDGIEDQGAVFRWPGSAADHAGRWWVDSGAFEPGEGWARDGAQPRSGPGLAVVWGAGDGWTAAFAAQTRAADADHAGLHRDGPGASLGWLLARRIGPVDAGVTWRSIAGGWSSDGDARDEFEHGRDDFGLGARVDLSPTAYLDLAGDVRRQANRLQGPGDPPSWDVGEQASARSWSARARVSAQPQPGWLFVAAAERLREDFTGPVAGEAWDTGAALAQDNRFTRVEATLGSLPDPDRMLAATLWWSRATTSREVVAGATEAPAAGRWRTLGLALAAERRVNWWLSLRASLALHRVTRGAPGDDPADAAANPVDATAGVGLHLGAWGADLAAGNAPLPEPWRWSEPDLPHRTWLRAALHHDF